MEKEMPRKKGWEYNNWVYKKPYHLDSVVIWSRNYPPAIWAKFYKIYTICVTLKEKKGDEINIELEFKVYYTCMYVVVQFYSWFIFLV